MLLKGLELQPKQFTKLCLIKRVVYKKIYSVILMFITKTCKLLRNVAHTL